MIIFDIKRGSVQDGPGIRTVVFFKGCPLRCRWCHNPESFIKSPQTAYRPDKCAVCKKCLNACPNGCHSFSSDIHLFDRAKCSACGRCAEVCRHNALEVFGYAAETDGIMEEVLKDRTYYNASGGGLTLSGGEPLFQPEGALSLAKAAYDNGVSVCVETSGYGDKNDILKLAEFCDLFLFDIKLIPKLYKTYTGRDSDIIFENLYQLDRAGAKIILRCPIIPGINMNEEHFSFVAELAQALKNAAEINLEAYHPIGLAKAASLGAEPAYKNPDFLEKTRLSEISEHLAASSGKRVRII